MQQAAEASIRLGDGQQRKVRYSQGSWGVEYIEKRK